MAQQKKPRKVGRPKLPKGAAKGRIVPVRFTVDELKKIEREARANQETISEWIRGRIPMEEKWTIVREDGRCVTLGYRELGRQSAQMTAKVEGDNFTQLLEKSGLTLPLSHEQVEKQFSAIIRPSHE